MKEDEFLEVTPKSIRLRKEYLSQTAKAKKDKGLK
jgi:predicted membrane GTPase involved in stress response